MTISPKLAPLLAAIATTAFLAGCSAGPPEIAQEPRTPTPTTKRSQPSAPQQPAAPPEPQAEPSPKVIQARPRPPRPAAPASPAPGSTSDPLPRAEYVFPIDPVSAASYGRKHHDYPATDIFAACGTTVVAPTSGVIQEVSRRDRWDPVVDDGATRGGLSVSVVGDDGVRYYGSHLQRIAAKIKPGRRIAAGEVLGDVGRTGSARETPCHVHFGLSPPRGPGDWEVRRGVVYPWPFLDAWAAGRDRSPRRTVNRWAAAHPA